MKTKTGKLRVWPTRGGRAAWLGFAALVIAMIVLPVPMLLALGLVILYAGLFVVER